MSVLMERALRWAAEALGGAKVVGVEGLPGGATPWLVRADRGGRPVQAVLRTGDGRTRALFATEAAALVLAEDHRLPAPRLLAVDLDGAAAGTPALLITALAGSSKIPAVASPSRLRAFGAAAAPLHAVAVTPTAELPRRLQPIADVDWTADRRATGSSPLLAAAEEALQSLPAPADATVFVHGDLWQGNTMWTGEALVGMVDWDCAGAGHYGIDVASMRLDAALMFGLPAAAEVLEGWQGAAGHVAAAMAYWDVVAAFNTPPDMVAWVAPFHRQGRTDLAPATLVDRRDAFLRAALDQLDRT